MISTREVGGKRKGILIGREEENFGRAVEREYIGEDSNTQIISVKSSKKVNEAYQKSKIIVDEKVSKGELIKTLTGHSDNVTSIVFSPNGEYLASGSLD